VPSVSTPSDCLAPLLTVLSFKWVSESFGANADAEYEAVFDDRLPGSLHSHHFRGPIRHMPAHHDYESTTGI